MESEIELRYVDDVIIKVLQFIPESEINIRNALINYKLSLFNKSPEALKTSDCWLPFINIMNSFITDFDENWKIIIRNIICNNEYLVKESAVNNNSQSLVTSECK